MENVSEVLQSNSIDTKTTCKNVTENIQQDNQNGDFKNFAEKDAPKLAKINPVVDLDDEQLENDWCQANQNKTKKCENPEEIIQDVEEWNMDSQLLIKENKRIKMGLNLFIDEREKLLKENAKLSGDIEMYHIQVKTSNEQLSRLTELDDENEELKNSLSDLQTTLEQQKQEHKKREKENVEKLKFLKDSHKEELENLTEQLTSNAEYEQNLLKEKISKYEREIVELQLEKNRIQIQKETELSQMAQEYENKLTNLQQQKIQQHQSKIIHQNEEMFRKKLKHMKDEYEREIRGLKRTIEDYRISSRPSPRNRERLTLTTVGGGKKRKSS